LEQALKENKLDREAFHFKFDILKFYSSEVRRLLDQYGVHDEQDVIMHTDSGNPDVGGIACEKTRDELALEPQQASTSNTATKPKISPKDIQIVHPNGNLIVASTLSKDSSIFKQILFGYDIRIYAPNGQHIGRMPQMGCSVNAMIILPNGNLVTASEEPNSSINIYNLTKKKLVHSIHSRFGVLLLAGAKNGNLVVLTKLSKIERRWDFRDFRGYHVEEYHPETGELVKTIYTQKRTSSPEDLLALIRTEKFEIGGNSKAILSIRIVDYQAPSIFDEITIEFPAYNQANNEAFMSAGRSWGAIKQEDRESAIFYVIRFSTPERIVRFLNILLTECNFNVHAEKPLGQMLPQLLTYQIAVNRPEWICDILISQLTEPRLSAVICMIAAHDFSLNDNTVKLSKEFSNKLVTKPIKNIISLISEALDSKEAISFNTFKNIYTRMMSEFLTKPLLKDPSFFNFYRKPLLPDPSCTELYNKILELMRESKLLWAIDAHKELVERVQCSHDIADIIVGYSL
jgi:hypothetical protein